MRAQQGLGPQSGSHILPRQVSPGPQVQVFERPQALVTVPHSKLLHVGAGQIQLLLVQLSPVPQPPQETVREAPQRSVTVIVPQVALAAPHSSVSVSGLQTQLLPEHCWVVALQVLGQVRELPHALETEPQAMPEQDGVGQTHMPLLQFSPAPQLPHDDTVREVPQLSVAVRLPQDLPWSAQNEALF